MAVQITILGLNQIGTSIGLALKTIQDQVQRIGNDREPTIARQAEKMGAVDKIVVNLHNAVDQADVVILAMPVDEIRETMEQIATDLKPGTLLVDTSPLQAAVMQWARELLPEDRYFISMTPSLNPIYMDNIAGGIDQAHDDLFKNSHFIVACPPGTDESALTLATNLVTTMGATPMFADAAEADGLLGAGHTLPVLVAAALINATTAQPGWREARKVAGAAYAVASKPIQHLDESQALGQSALLNSENAARMLDAMIDSLLELREHIRAQDADALQKALERAQKGRAEWQKQRYAADWEPKQENRVPTGGEVIGRLFGLRPARDKKK